MEYNTFGSHGQHVFIHSIGWSVCDYPKGFASKFSCFGTLSYNNDLVINGIIDKGGTSLGYLYRKLIGAIKMEWLYASLRLCKLISIIFCL